jgi:hypothetical protein
MKKLCLLFLFMFPGCCLAWDTPSQVLDAFLQYELDGGRLDSDGWKTYVARYAAVPPGYDESGWDRVTLVESYTVAKPKCSDAHCTAVVRFKLLPTKGLADQQLNQFPKGGVETVVFKVVKTNDGWRIRPFNTWPHIRLATLRRTTETP